MASGNDLCSFAPQAGEPTLTNSAVKLTRSSTAHPCIQYANGSDLEINFTGQMPDLYSGGGLTVNLSVVALTAITGAVNLGVSFERIGIVQDLDTDSFAAERTVTGVTVSATAGIPVIGQILFADGAQIDNIAAGDSFRMKVRRLGAADTLADAMQLRIARIVES